MTLKEMRTRRTDIEKRMKALLDGAEKENRDLNADETKEWDTLLSEDNGLKGRIERSDQLGAITRDLDQPSNDSGDPRRASRVGQLRDEVLGTRAGEQRDEEPSLVLRSDQSAVEHFRAAGIISEANEYRGLTLGGFCRAMVSGARNEVERRALSEGTDSAGGYTVPTVLLARMIDRLRIKATLLRSGAQVVPLTTEKTSIARLASDPTAAWRLEAGVVSETNATFERIEFTARSMACLVKASRELLDDSLNVESALLNAFAQAMALELDRVGLLGSGTAPEPRGIANTTNVNAVSMGTNGAALTNYDPFIDALLALENDNAAMPTSAIMAPRTAATIAKLKDTTNQPLQRPVAIASLPFYSTTQIPVNDTHGTAVNASRIITGDFARCLVGIRTSLRVEVLREKYAETLEYGFLAHLRADVQLEHPESFCQITGIIP